MTGKHRSKIQIERDRLTISELYLKGWSQQRIADYLELDKSRICRELKKIKAEWKAEAIEDHNLYVNQELRRLAMLQAEYWEGWARSQQLKEATSVNTLVQSGQTLGATKVATRTQQQIGDVQFLNGIQKVIDTRARLLGLYPGKTETNVQTQPKIVDESTDFSTWTDDQLRQYIASVEERSSSYVVALPDEEPTIEAWAEKYRHKTIEGS